MREMPISHTIPDTHTPILRDMMCAGGYPLWLIGGASFYTDIDLYPANWQTYYRWLRFFEAEAAFVSKSPYSTSYVYAGDTWQLIHPAQKSLMDLMATSDLSPCATAMGWGDDGQAHVYTLYPDDIAQRVCRVRTRHDWTEYRLEVYVRKGYHSEW